MLTVEKQLQIAIRRYWPCQKKTSTVALTEKEFNLKVERIMSMLSISTGEMRTLVANRLSSQWVRLPPLEMEKDGYSRTYPRARKIEVKKSNDTLGCFMDKRANAKHDGYQMFRKDESRALKWRQVR